MNRLTRRGLLTAFLLALSMHVIVGAQGGGQNINVITGSGNQFTGDLFRQRQNESVIGISSINPANILIAYNDYRVVDVADDFGVGTVAPTQGFVARLRNFFRAPWRLGGDGTPPKELKAAAFAWIGLSFSNNGGRTFHTGLLPGRYSPVPPNTHPLLGDTYRFAEFDAASDPVMAATPNQLLLGGIAFNPPGPTSNGRSIGFVARFTDRNNAEQGQTLHYDGMKILFETDSSAKFVDKPSIAAGANGHVYAAFVVFDQADPSQLSSKILFFRSADYGETWLGPVVVSDPLTRNQSPWILVDPRNEEIVYIGWRVFTAPKGRLSNAIVGRKSFNGGASFIPPAPYAVMESLRAFDQPQGNLSTGTPPVPRSNAYPTATIDGNGTIHAAIQEYVYPHTANQNQRGRPLNQATPVTHGVPRITVSSSYDGGVSWTQRRAVDLGTATVPAGTQFMPVLASAGEPGPSCAGSTGPRSRVMVMYYDARASGWGAVPGTQGYVIGGGAQFDVRIAQASACSTGGLTFSPSEQVSQYTRNAEAPFAIQSMSGEKHPGSQVDPINYPKTNRLYTAFCGGNCGFTGDYIGLSPRVPYVLTSTGWKATTAVTDPGDRDNLPAPVVQGVWADTRDALFPSEGPLRSVPAGSTGIDVLPWHVYQPPGTGLAPCVNPGTRDQNVYTAEYTPGGLFASAPATFRSSTLARSYPLFIENRTPATRFYRVTIESGANASFDYTDFDSNHPNFGAPLTRVTAIKIGPISSVTGSVVVGPGVNTSIAITVEETTAPVINDAFQTVTDGVVIPPPQGARTTVYLVTDGADATNTETYTPSLDPVPVVSKPFGKPGESSALPLNVDPAPALIPSPTPFSPNPNLTGSTFMENPFSPNPFSPNPFSPNPFSPNPFSPNPFSPNPFSVNATVYDVTDVSYVIRNEGDQTAAFRAFASLTASSSPNRVYQALINRAVPTPITLRDALGNCVTADSWAAVPISTIQNPFSPNPFSPNPFSPNPFSPNPFSPNPFSPNPFSPNYPPEFSNSTFYVKPAPSGPSAGYAAPPNEDVIVFTIREFLLVQPDPTNPNDPNRPLNPADLNVILEAQVPEQPTPGGGFDARLPSAGTGVPHHLEFINHPANGSAMVPLAPVTVVAEDAFGGPVSSNASSGIPVTLSIGNNPANGILGGTTTRLTVSGIATFDDLTISKAGTGYTLVASSDGLQSHTSNAFNIAMVLANATLLDGIDETPYPPSPQSLQVVGGTAPLTFALDPDAQVNRDGVLVPATLPPGLALDANTGVISGTATTPGEYAFRVIATDSLGNTAAANYCIHVDENLGANLITTDLNNGATAAGLAQSLADPDEAGVTIANATTSGAAFSIGRFTGGGGATAGVGFDRGVLLASGDIAGARGPNNSSSHTTGTFSPTPDSDLAAIANWDPNDIYDTAILQFDFTPTCTGGATTCNVTFEYVFGSDEYHEYANSNFNDAFAFFVTDLTTLTRKNYALLPGIVPETAVTINNVNGGNPLGTNAQNSAFFRSNTADPAPLNVQADGLTRPLQFNAPVVSGRTYRIKIGITDVNDHRYDSWVFVKSGSLKVTHICPIIVQ